jgi:hypothetical protein
LRRVVMVRPVAGRGGCALQAGSIKAAAAGPASVTERRWVRWIGFMMTCCDAG